MPIEDPILVYSKASSIASGSDSDDNILSPLTTVLNSQPRPVASTAPPPHVVVPSSSGIGTDNPPPPATAPGQPSHTPKQTQKKASQEARDVAVMQVKVRKKVERQEALERKDTKRQEARRKAHNAKQKEVSQLWQDEVFHGGFEVDLPFRSSQ